MLSKIFIAFQYAVPQQLLTRFVGVLARSTAPWVKGPFIALFAKKFKVNMTEAAEPDLKAYESFNHFFTRALKPGARPIADSPVVSPADGTISQIGQIEAGAVFQAKGKAFDVTQLLGDAESARPYLNGAFTTIYLAPKDYHRLHMPTDGVLQSTTYIPGKLFSVNEVTAEHIDGLFAMNERLVMHFSTDLGPMAAVMVGAMIVGGMETIWDSNVAQGRAAVVRKDWSSGAIQMRKGEELGRFMVGSTIILCFQPGAIQWGEQFSAGASIRVGQALANLAS